MPTIRGAYSETLLGVSVDFWVRSDLRYSSHALNRVSSLCGSSFPHRSTDDVPLPRSPTANAPNPPKWDKLELTERQVEICRPPQIHIPIMFIHPDITRRHGSVGLMYHRALDSNVARA